jgi:ABC-2 type transport system ATP-binding protein
MLFGNLVKNTMGVLPVRRKMSVILAKNLSKKYLKLAVDPENILRITRIDKEAVANFDLEINEGEMVGFLGPNGAGKTTILKILSGIIWPTSGEASVLGYTPWQKEHSFLKQIAIVMGQKNQLWWDLPAKDSFMLLKEIYEIPEEKFKKKLRALMDVLSMHEIVERRLRNLSLGERMKCELAACLLHEPKIIFLDEPTIGLDIISAQAIRNFIKDINKMQKCTIILTSHYMGDIEELCKRVVIINHGIKVYDGDFKSLISKYAPEKVVKINLSEKVDKEKFAKLSGKKHIEDGVGIIKSTPKDLSSLAKEIFGKFSAENITIQDPDTEDVIAKIYSAKK